MNQRFVFTLVVELHPKAVEFLRMFPGSLESNIATLCKEGVDEALLDTAELNEELMNEDEIMFTTCDQEVKEITI